jgi:hypothetical protein
MEPRHEKPKVPKIRTEDKPKKRFCILQLEERIAPKMNGHKSDGGAGVPSGL